MYCQKCGKQVSEADSFCVNCGNHLYLPNHNTTNIYKSNLSRNDIRNEEIRELKRMINYFSSKEKTYQAFSESASRVEHFDEDKSVALLVFGIIFTGFFGLIALTLISHFQDTRDFLTPFFIMVFAFFFTAAPGICMISGYKKYARAFEKKREVVLREYDTISEQLRKEYIAYENCPLGFEYCTPEFLSVLLEIILSGRADTIKEALNLVADESKYKVLSERLKRIEKNARIAAIW